MAQQTISLGTSANDGTGDSLRDGGTKINANFTELYGRTEAATTSSSGIVELATPAETVTGTDAARATTPAGVKAATDALIVHGSWTPVIKQNATTLTATVTVAKYTKIGKKVFCELRASLTSAGTSGQINVTGLPFATTETDYYCGGSFIYLDTGTAYYSGAAFFQVSDGSVRFLCDNKLDFFGAAPAVVAASGDMLSFSFQYETA